MAGKSQRFHLALICSVCKNQNYLSERNKINTPEKLKMMKFCRKCRKTTEHKETSKLD